MSGIGFLRFLKKLETQKAEISQIAVGVKSTMVQTRCGLKAKANFTKLGRLPEVVDGVAMEPPPETATNSEVPEAWQ